MIKGTILKDKTFGLLWEVTNEETLELTCKNGGTITKISEDKLSNFDVVFVPKKEEEKTIPNINYSLNDNGYIIDADTQEPIIEQGILRFSYISKLFIEEGFLYLGIRKDFSYGDIPTGVTYLYDIKNNKFKRLEENVSLYPFCTKNGFVETKKFYIFNFTRTGTYGDFKRGDYVLLNKKTKKMSKRFGFGSLTVNPYVINDTGKEIIACIPTRHSIGAFTSRYDALYFVKFSEDKLEVLCPYINIGGGDKPYNSNCFLKNGKKLSYYNGTNLAFIDLNTFELISNYSLNSNVKNGLTNMNRVCEFKKLKNSCNVTFVSNKNSNVVKVEIKDSKDLGYIQKIV